MTNDFFHPLTIDILFQVSLPDGRIQTVTYHADHEGGFVADVTYEGTPVYPDPPAGGYGPYKVRQRNLFTTDNYLPPFSNDLFRLLANLFMLLPCINFPNTTG